MQLRAWLEKEEMSVAEFARRLDRSYLTVWRWLRGVRTPNKDMRKRVRGATGGEVMPADWFTDE
jgi:transcriptional regulator with XRE-family HTH domain